MEEAWKNKVRRKIAVAGPDERDVSEAIQKWGGGSEDAYLLVMAKFHGISIPQKKRYCKNSENQ